MENCFCNHRLDNFFGYHLSNKKHYFPKLAQIDVLKDCPIGIRVEYRILANLRDVLRAQRVAQTRSALEPVLYPTIRVGPKHKAGKGKYVPNYKVTCRRCGRSPGHNRASCPAREGKCSKCHMTGHYGAVRSSKYVSYIGSD